MCVKNGGLRTGKRKRGVPEDMRGQLGQEGAGQDEAVTRATKGTDTKVGVMAHSTAREHGKQRKGGKHVMVSSKDRSMSTHSEKNIDIRGKPMGGKRGAGRVDTPRCAARKRRNPACNRGDRESIRRIYEADKERSTGTTTTFGRTERGRKCGHRKWRSGCSRWFEDTQWTWRIGWRQ